MAKRTAIVWSDEITNSSHIRQIGYNMSRRTLHVIFLNNDHYRYRNVPPDIVIDFLNASSHGIYFWQHIRGAYSYIRL